MTHKLVKWAEEWDMQFNINVMHLGIHNQKYKYSMNGVEIKSVEETDVGIKLANNLKPGLNVKQLLEKLSLFSVKSQDPFTTETRECF